MAEPKAKKGGTNMVKNTNQKQNRASFMFLWILCLLAQIMIAPVSFGQMTYQKYDCTTRGAEYHIAKSQMESNRQMIKMLEYEKSKYNVMDPRGSVTRSRIQGVIGAKEEENFRLGQKAFLLNDANKIDDVNRYNKTLQTMRPKVVNNR